MAETVSLAEAIERGLAHHRAGRLKEAEEIYRQILAQTPNEPEVLHLLGFLAFQVGRYDASVELISRAIALNPARARFYDNLGSALRMLGRPIESTAAHAKALELDADDFEARSNLALAYMTMRQFDHAETELRQVLTRRPDLAEVWSNYSGVLRELRRMNESIAAAQRAIELKSNIPEAHNNLAIALASQGRQDEALAEYRKSVELRPENAWAHSNVLLSMHYLPQFSPEEIFREHKKWAAMHAQSNVGCASAHRLFPGQNNWRDEAHPTRRLRIAYISADLYGHVVSYFIEPILREHDHSKFEILCYADLANPDSTSQRLLSLADSIRVIKGMPSETVAQTIQQDGIDILVDLGGHTAPQILRVLAMKPAPVQATYLGYPDTTGLSTVDYRITDEIADPPGLTERFHTEKLMRLNRCAWCFCPQKEAWDAKPTELDRNRPITFGSFNSLAKVTPWVIELWADVLKAVPRSRLLLKAYTLAEEATKNILRENFARFGVDSRRLILESHQRLYVDHLNLYNQVDVALDSYPYNGTTTTCEAMWMGVPVVHLAGKTHVSRVGRSLLSAVGLANLSADSREEYVEIAAKLARDRDQRVEFRKILREKMQLSPLTDAKGIAQAMEEAHRKMWAAASTIRV